jgi:hypothetical protein
MLSNVAMLSFFWAKDGRFSVLGMFGQEWFVLSSAL